MRDYMKTTDIHLRFPSEQKATSLMLEAGILIAAPQDDGTEVLVANEGCLVDVIGEIPNASGWHVNFRGNLPTLLSDYKIEVSGTPYRIWD